MSILKRSAAVLVAAVALLVAAAMPAFADDDYTITVQTEVGGKEYHAYQIFAGTVSGDILSNVVWGSGVNAEDGKIEGRTASEYVSDLQAGTITAEQFAQIVDGHLPGNGVTLSRNTEGTGYAATVTGGGYYLIVDKSTPGDYGTYDAHILRVAGNVTVSPKSGAPTLTKQVSKVLSSQYVNAISLSRGDTAYFSLTATLPSNIAHYEKYHMVITDTLPCGLSLASSVNDIHVYVVNGNTHNEVKESDRTIEVGTNQDGMTTITVTIDDVKTAVPNADENKAPIVASDTIVVAFEAKLNGEESVYGSDGNVNEAVLKYSNDPNDPDSYRTSLSQTPLQTARVYSYQLKITKVDSADGTELAGASFKVHRYKDGTTDQYLKETVTSTSHVHEWVTDIDDATEFTTDSDGKIEIRGLSSGVYRLIETKAPAGYNLAAEPIRLTINDSIGSDGTLEALSASAEGGSVSGTPVSDKGTGTVSITVKNNAGATLPTTGGIGATIFYVVGAALVICAAAALIVKRRGAERR